MQQEQVRARQRPKPFLAGNAEFAVDEEDEGGRAGWGDGLGDADPSRCCTRRGSDAGLTVHSALSTGATTVMGIGVYNKQSANVTVSGRGFTPSSAGGSPRSPYTTVRHARSARSRRRKGKTGAHRDSALDALLETDDGLVAENAAGLRNATMSVCQFAVRRAA